MKGILFHTDKNDKKLIATVDPTEVNPTLKSTFIIQQIREGEFKDFWIFEASILDLVAELNQANKEGKTKSFDTIIGERRDAEVSIKLADDLMSASLVLTGAFGGKIPDATQILSKITHAGVTRGISKKRIKQAAIDLASLPGGENKQVLVAKGLPPRPGKHSKVKPLVENALERILQPQSVGGDKVDMRNLGDVICVKVGSPLLRRLPPTAGRAGYSIQGDPLAPEPGQVKALEVGSGTKISEKDGNLLVAAIAGMPKFKDEQMWVDETFICSGVNVGTGNINYDGAVLVNGDVTEKMVIAASGDITVNGFVESATLQAGGDIIITEGALGKVDDASVDFSCKLVAQGSVFIQHGQGLDIVCNGNVNVGRQLAYSQVGCQGGVTVGDVNNPQGNLFACDITCHSVVRAGTLGAVSGSALNIDFSGGFNLLQERREIIEEMLQQLEMHRKRHKAKLDKLRVKGCPADLEYKLEKAITLYEDENQLMNWMYLKVGELKTAKDNFGNSARLEASKKIYPGVNAKLNNKSWRADRERSSALVYYNQYQWEVETLNN